MRQLHIAIPTSYDQLNQKQLMGLMDIVLSTSEKVVQKQKAFQYLSNIKRSEWIKLSLEQKVILGSYCNWIFEPQLLENPFLKLNGFTGPREEFRDMSFLEFIHALTAFQRFITTHKIQELQYFAAIIYRTKRLFNQEDFNDESIEQRIKKVKRFEVKKLLIISFWFSCNLQTLPIHYTKLYQGVKTKKQPDWTVVLIDVAGDKMGTVDKVAAQGVHTVLTYLNKNLKEKQQ